MATYKPEDNNSSRNSELSYDPVKRQWVEKSSGVSTMVQMAIELSARTAMSVSKGTALQTTSNVVNNNSESKVDSKGAADKEYIDIEYNTLEGELRLTSTEKSIRIKVNDTIQLEGVGKYLSGLYYVAGIKRTLNKDTGYTHTLTVIKTGFGNSLKSSQGENNSRLEEVQKDTGAFKVGDKVKIIGSDAVYSNADDGVKVPEWVKQQTLTVEAVSSDGTRVRLNPIFSWTYVKYVQKV